MSDDVFKLSDLDRLRKAFSDAPNLTPLVIKPDSGPGVMVCMTDEQIARAEEIGLFRVERE